MIARMQVDKEEYAKEHAKEEKLKKMSEEVFKAEDKAAKEEEEDRQLEKIVNRHKAESESTKRKQKWDEDMKLREDTEALKKEKDDWESIVR